MKSRLYAYSRYRKSVKFISDLTRYINACKISIILPNYQSSKSIAILEDNITNCLDLLLDNNKKSICPGASNHSKEEIRPIRNNNKDIRLANINQQRLTTST